VTRIAIVGAGTMGQLHAQSCLNLPDAQVTWVADRHAGRAAALAAALGAGCRATTDNEEALSADDVDAVLVCVPTPDHREVTELAAARGKHVFCEKPIARTLADGEAMVEVCRRAGVRLMVGHVVRFFPEYARIHQLLREDAVGQVGVVRASRVNAYPRTDRGWYADFEACGGPIVDLMVHDLDTLRWYFGEVARAYARGLSHTPAQPTTDYALALLRFESGVIAHVEASWAHATFRTAIEVYGEHGALRHASEESAAIRLERVGTEEDRAAVQVPSSPLAEGPYQAELRHFLDCLRHGTPFLVDGEEAIRSLALSLAVLESARTGRPVHLADGRPQLQEAVR
jgi:UDP-N-acetylglucosamine 3-dehydrogenase